jgi:hypothetical protein
MKLPLALAGLALLCLPAYARLGETESQLVARFGNPDQDHTTGQFGQYQELDFQKTGFTISIVLLNGHSAKEIYRKTTGDPITEEEQRNLLFINSGKQRWIETTPPGDAKFAWLRDDASVAIRTDVGGSQFIFESTEYLAAEAAAYKKAHYSSTIGF